jgi:osmotically-inducible protein OsmY
MCVFQFPCDGTARPSDAGTSLANEAERLLHASSYSSLRNISCQGRDGTVYLHGRLPSYYLKQLAQEIVSRVKGAVTVVNRIEVKASDRATYSGRASERIHSSIPVAGGFSSPSHRADGRSLQPCWS